MDLSDSFTQLAKKLNKRNFLTLSIICSIALSIGGAIYYFADGKAGLQASVASVDEVELGSFPVVVPTIKYGFALDTFNVIEESIRSGQFLADILLAQKVDYPSIEQIVRNSVGVFDVKHLRAGGKYTILTKDPDQRSDYFIYEPSVYEYVVFDLKNDFKVTRHEREVVKEVDAAGGVINSSLWNAMVDNGMDYELAAKMEDALQWSIDFHHLQKGDQFKLVYDQNFVEGDAVGIGNVHAAFYKNGKNEYYAIYFNNGEHKGYYDLEGRPMNKGFLKAPVKYSRISSYYNLNRYHPILKHVRPHFGTDYAAPYGTPIYAVGDGVVTQASYTGGNGNFVKIRHDGTYETQYLHMQKFAKGIHKGVHVRQGQVIGYVGSTGLATGPHVCFRFWKNGKQVNHLNLNFPPPAPLPAKDLPEFYKVRDEYLSKLENVDLEKVTAMKSEGQLQGGNP